VVHPEHGPGFDVWVGGGLSTNPMLAQRLGAWVPEAEVPDVWEAVVSVFRDYGYRRLRARARLKFLVADWGVRGSGRSSRTSTSAASCSTVPAPPAPDTPSDHVGVHRQRDGRFYVGVAPAVGRVSGSLLGKVADVIEAHGSGRVRTTAQQKLLVLDVEGRPGGAAGHRPRPARPARAAVALAAQHDGVHRPGVLQAGDRRHQGPGDLARGRARAPRPGAWTCRSPSTSTAVPNSCARTQVADVGSRA
jgi:sulfite reductase (ferredoxin)